jgi:DNA replication and repair protein RecF
LLSHLKISGFRNINHLEIDLGDNFNIFVGENGSGKTSLLEAIYHLSLGRSFRTRNPGKVIQFGKDKFSVFGEISSISVGIERYLDGKMRLRKVKKDVKSIAELTDIFPIQLINPDIYQLINSGAEARKRFINWGVFHVKPKIFLKSWNQMRRVVQQRNAALKQFRPSKEEITLWDGKLAEVAAPIKAEQQDYVVRFKQKVAEIIPSLLEIQDLDFVYYPGWDDARSLQEILAENLTGDLQRGYTQFGPHRAHLRIMVGEKFVKDVLSRGQQKLLASAMLLAQITLLEQETGKKCALLVDDLTSELDEDKRERIAAEIAKLKTQTFITGTEIGSLTKIFDQKASKVFQLDQGVIRTYDAVSL